MVAAGWHPSLRRHSGPVPLAALLLYIVLVRERLLGIQGHAGHVVAGHVRVLGHSGAAALRGDVLPG